MKKWILTACLGVFTLSLVGQQRVWLKINHQLDGAPFAFNTPAYNNRGEKFNVQRLEYFLSQFAIKHDGDKTTQVDSFALVNAGSNTLISLGMHDSIQQVQSISFGVGVYAPVNNADPAQWPAGHPLAPRNPSMHWGWTSGYRFVAMEGKAGENLLTTYEIHALGNENYFTTEVPVSANVSGNDLVIELFADYSRGIAGIAISQNVISHGVFGEAETLLENYRDYVFSATAHTASLTPAAAIPQTRVYPNPTENGQGFQISLDSDVSIVELRDLQGRVIREWLVEDKDAKFPTHDLASGIYLIRTYAGNQLKSQNKVSVK